MSANVSAIRDEKGKVVRSRSVLRDITDYKRDQETIKRAHRELETVLQAIPSILVGVDSEGHVVHWSASAEQTFGPSSSQVLGHPFSQLDIGWDWTTVQRFISENLHTGKPKRLPEIDFRRPDGKKGLVGVGLSPMRGQESGGFLLIGRSGDSGDVSEGTSTLGSADSGALSLSSSCWWKTTRTRPNWLSER